MLNIHIKKITIAASIVSIILFQTAALAAQENTESAQPNIQSEGFTINPANPKDPNPRQFNFQLKPGELVKDSVTVQNLASEESTFFLYGADPTFSTQGTPAYKTRQAGGNGEGNWIKFDEPKITLKSNEKRTLQFTIKIPKDTKEEEYRAGIAMEKTKQDINNPNITIATRVIVHTNIKVTKNALPQSSNGAQTPWQIYYFWISLILFISSFIGLVWITFKGKKQPLQTVSTTSIMEVSEKKKIARKAATTIKKTIKKRNTNTTKKSTVKKTTTKKSPRKSTNRKK